MRTKRWVMAVMVAVAAIAPSAAAQDQSELPEGHPPVHGRGMGKGMCAMHGMMKGGMLQGVGVGQDGSVYVLAGTKLLKYDADLKLVKEQTIPVDLSAMKGACPMCPMAQGAEGGEAKAGE